MRASDALLVSLDGTPGLEGFVPSKLFDCCAVRRPVVVAAAGEAADLASRADAALCVPPSNPAELVAAVRRLGEDGSLRERLAVGARAFAEENSRERGVEKLEAVLAGVTKSTGGNPEPR
jgi:glycosyltransferase involved in cell wall biosynthesis